MGRRVSKEGLHNLVDRLPEAEVAAAMRFLEFLCAGIDDEPLTPEDWESIREGEAAIAKGDSIGLDELKRKAAVPLSISADH